MELEGVLVDTREARRAALLESLTEEGVVLDATEFDEVAVGMTPRQGARALLARHGRMRDETTIDLIAMRADRAFGARLGKGITMQPGAMELVSRMHGCARLALVSRARRREVDFVLGLSGLDLAFESVVTADDVREPKPSEEGYVAALARLHRRAVLAPIACVALEDSIAGIRAARRAGLRCVAVGALPAHRVLEADGVVASLVGITPRFLETVAPVPSGFASDGLRGTRPA